MLTLISYSTEIGRQVPRPLQIVLLYQHYMADPPVQYLADTAMRHLQLAADLTGSYALQGQLQDLHSQVLRQRATIGEDATILVDVLASNCTIRYAWRRLLHCVDQGNVEVITFVLSLITKRMTLNKS